MGAPLNPAHFSLSWRTVEKSPPWKAFRRTAIFTPCRRHLQTATDCSVATARRGCSFPRFNCFPKLLDRRIARSAKESPETPAAAPVIRTFLKLFARQLPIWKKAEHGDQVWRRLRRQETAAGGLQLSGRSETILSAIAGFSEHGGARRQEFHGQTGRGNFAHPRHRKSENVTCGIAVRQACGLSRQWGNSWWQDYVARGL